jgi:hypothetical protein
MIDWNNSKVYGRKIKVNVQQKPASGPLQVMIKSVLGGTSKGNIFVSTPLLLCSTVKKNNPKLKNKYLLPVTLNLN